ncbi:MAG: UDP-glucose 4-epimerase GalE [Gammaproteobacteria bacterium]|jgi:UDP-glucose 4-epimerase|nr:UDP-glucose 4-epimerase GalE [Gammaproteobacteria bacterium]MBT6043213.1 UDP-glucose 4-epimerase GalE [Gammaproteobacteria bacterium]
MKILICGGAGYIGSHIAKAATEAGHKITIVDNLVTGHKESIPGLPFHQGNIGDLTFMESVLKGARYDLVMHFCAFSLVGESFTDPESYYQNNVAQTLNLLQVMKQTGHKRLVFSSTAATYGNPEQDKINENHPKNPINPYGRAKWMIEQILQDYSAAYRVDSVCLRYFNAAGSDPSATIGEKHKPETHLIPNTLKSVASGGELTLNVFGTDYPTPDGSCVRDYIHVNDLASAHLLAGEYLQNNSGYHAFNLGIGKGFSVLEVIKAAEAVTGQKIEYKLCDRRPGDPPVLVADSTLAQQTLNWQPWYTSIENIIATAWSWHKNRETFKSQ